jgi:hypothetical protein
MIMMYPLGKHTNRKKFGSLLVELKCFASNLIHHWLKHHHQHQRLLGGAKTKKQKKNWVFGSDENRNSGETFLTTFSRKKAKICIFL